MRGNGMKLVLVLVAVLGIAWLPVLAAEPFEPADSVATNLAQMRKLPTDRIWWRVNGRDMWWNNRNVQAFYPAVNVYRAGPVRELAYDLDPKVRDFAVPTPQGPQPFVQFLDSDASTTMGVVILHHGRIVFEHYPRQQPYEKPIYWSVTKAFVGTLVAMLEDLGRVDVRKPVETYIPELDTSPYAGVPVRDILDMASGVDCADDYDSETACYHCFAESYGDEVRTAGSPDNPYDFVAHLKVGRRAEPGTSFAYSGVDTFVLGWLVEKVTGMPLNEALSKQVWTRIGAESDAAFLAPRLGIPLAEGGLLATVRDVARFGLLFTPSWKVVTDQPLISGHYLDTILHGGNPQLLENSNNGNVRGAETRFNIYQWDRVFTNDDFTKGGFGGQGLLINPRLDLVAVWTGYFDDAGKDDNLLAMLRAIFKGVYGDEPASRK